MQARIIGVAVATILSVPLYSSAASIAELQAQIQTLMALIATLQAQTTASLNPQSGSGEQPRTALVCPNLTRTLSRGMKGTDVTQLQTFLISQNHLASGNNTGFYGALTEKAVQAFQKKHAVVSSGAPTSTGYGSVGARTRAVMMRLCSGKSGSIVPDTSYGQESASGVQDPNSHTYTQGSYVQISPYAQSTYGAYVVQSSNTQSSSSVTSYSQSSYSTNTATAVREPWLVFTGDSRTDPGGAGGNSGPDYTWSWRFMHNDPYFALPGSQTSNQAQNGYTTQLVLNQFASGKNYLRNPNGIVYFFVWVGINDVLQDVPAATAYARLKQIWAQARMLGYKVVAFTAGPACLPENSAVNLATLDALIRSDRSLYDVLVQPDMILPTPLCDGATQYFADYVHPSAAGNELLQKEITRMLPRWY